MFMRGCMVYEGVRVYVGGGCGYILTRWPLDDEAGYIFIDFCYDMSPDVDILAVIVKVQEDESFVVVLWGAVT